MLPADIDNTTLKLIPHPTTPSKDILVPNSNFTVKEYWYKLKYEIVPPLDTSGVFFIQSTDSSGQNSEESFFFYNILQTSLGGSIIAESSVDYGKKWIIQIFPTYSPLYIQSKTTISHSTLNCTTSNCTVSLTKFGFGYYEWEKAGDKGLYFFYFSLFKLIIFFL